MSLLAVLTGGSGAAPRNTMYNNIMQFKSMILLLLLIIIIMIMILFMIMIII